MQKRSIPELFLFVTNYDLAWLIVDEKFIVHLTCILLIEVRETT